MIFTPNEAVEKPDSILIRPEGVAELPMLGVFDANYRDAICFPTLTDARAENSAGC
jgi:hypothetical protein